METQKFKRDINSQGLINQNINELEAYKQRRKLRNKVYENEKQFEAMQNDINIIKTELEQIKTILQKFLTRG